MIMIAMARRNNAIFQLEDIIIGMGPIKIRPPACFSVVTFSGK